MNNIIAKFLVGVISYDVVLKQDQFISLGQHYHLEANGVLSVESSGIKQSMALMNRKNI